MPAAPRAPRLPGTIPAPRQPFSAERQVSRYFQLPSRVLAPDTGLGTGGTACRTPGTAPGGAQPVRPVGPGQPGRLLSSRGRAPAPCLHPHPLPQQGQSRLPEAPQLGRAPCARAHRLTWPWRSTRGWGGQGHCWFAVSEVSCCKITWRALVSPTGNAGFAAQNQITGTSHPVPRSSPEQTTRPSPGQTHTSRML